jgi:hypothetical protein
MSTVSVAEKVRRMLCSSCSMTWASARLAASADPRLRSTSSPGDSFQWITGLDSSGEGPCRVNKKGNFRLRRFQTPFFYDSVAGFSGHLIPDVGMLSRRRPVVKQSVTNGPIQGSSETGRTLNCLVSKMRHKMLATAGLARNAKANVRAAWSYYEEPPLYRLDQIPPKAKLRGLTKKPRQEVSACRIS